MDLVARSRPRGRATTLFALVIPVGLSVSAIFVLLGWRDRLPDPVAIHWGPQGIDAYGPLTQHIVMPLGVIVPVFCLAAWAVAMFAPIDARARRAAAASSMGLAVTLIGAIGSGLALQLDLDDASQAVGFGWAGVLSIVAGIAAAGLTAWLMPREPRPTSTREPRSDS